MLHLAGCVHFYEDQPPREATAEELVNLPVCSTCAATVRSEAGPPGTFTCTGCFLTLSNAQRHSSGTCRECASNRGEN